MVNCEAFSPAHITGFFMVEESESPERKGSRGAGVSLARGVRTVVKTVKAHKWTFSIRVNGDPHKAVVSETVLEEFSRFTSYPYEIYVDHYLAVPIGAGYGTSGAVALSLALALNAALDLGLTKAEAGRIAHNVEVKCRTGLGTVLAAFYGGVGIRERSGAPGIGVVKRIETDGEKVVSLCCGPLFTSRFLADSAFKRKVNVLGSKLIEELLQEPSIINFLVRSRMFSDGIDIYTPELRMLLSSMDRAGFSGFAMNMFGDAIFTVARGERLQRLLHLLRANKPPSSQLIVSDIDPLGARLIDKSEDTGYAS